jgi:rhamnosyltransferase
MVGAIVVGYFPEFLILNNLLRRLIEQVDFVVFIDNGGGRDFLTQFPQPRVQYVDLCGNQGLGFALNRGFELAVERGCEYVATFDQDSVLPDGMIAGLLEAHCELSRRGENCAAVSPIFYDRREGRKTRFPFYREIGGSVRTITTNASPSGLIEVDVLITSGMLVKATLWQSGLHYNSSLFVDYTDTDWCFRVKAEGQKLFACSNQEMGHALSDAPPVRFFWLSFFRYSPLRRYYYFRNTVYIVRQPYVSFAWKRRLAFGLVVRFIANLIIDENKLSSLKMMSLGFFHAITGRAGAYK